MGLVKCSPQGSWRHQDKAMVPTVPGKLLLRLSSEIGTNDCRVTNCLMIFPETHYGRLCLLSGAGYSDKATDWSAEESWFDSRNMIDTFPFSKSVHTRSWAHSASFSMGTWSSFRGSKSGSSVKFTSHFF